VTGRIAAEDKAHWGVWKPPWQNRSNLVGRGLRQMVKKIRMVGPGPVVA
jgi:hypothetical protein